MCRYPPAKVEAGIESERQKQLSDFFDQHAIQLNEEGLVVKDLAGSYEVRGRTSALPDATVLRQFRTNCWV